MSKKRAAIMGRTYMMLQRMATLNCTQKMWSLSLGAAVVARQNQQLLCCNERFRNKSNLAKDKAVAAAAAAVFCSPSDRAHLLLRVGQEFLNYSCPQRRNPRPVLITKWDFCARRRDTGRRLFVLSANSASSFPSGTQGLCVYTFATKTNP